MDGEGDDVSATEAWHAEVAIGREIAAEADRIEADYIAKGALASLTVEEAWHGCRSAVDDADPLRFATEHHPLVRGAAWWLVALRAEARETAAAKGGGHG